MRPTTVDMRVTALRYAVGSARCYALQLDGTLEELAELGADDLADLQAAVERAHAAVKAIDRIATPLLRREP